MNVPAVSPLDSWPDLPLDAWKETYATLHMWTQIVGKIRLAQCPWVNHSWHVTLYVTTRGLGSVSSGHAGADARARGPDSAASQSASGRLGRTAAVRANHFECP